MSKNKPLDRFQISLPPLGDGYTNFPGGTYSEFGYSPLHALSNLLRKSNCQSLVDNYYAGFQRGSHDIDIRIYNGSHAESTRSIPDIRALRSLVAEKTGKKASEVMHMRYIDLYRGYRASFSPDKNQPQLPLF